MISLTVYGKKYNVPSKFSEVTIKQYKDAFQLVTDKDYDIKFLAALGQIPIKDLKKVAIREVKFFLMQLSKLIDEGKDYIEKEYERPAFVEVDKVKYYVPKDIGKESYSQYSSATQMADDHKDERLGTYLNFLLSIYCLKKGESFGDIDINDRLELFEKVLFADAWKVHCFFLLNSPEYLLLFQPLQAIKPQATKSKPDQIPSKTSGVNT